MVTPIKKGAAEPTYAPVPTNNNTSTSPDPGTPGLDQGFLSPEQADAALLGRRDSAFYPAPSIISRDSTHASLPGTPALQNEPGARDSWGSGTGLATAAAGFAGAPRPQRGQSALAHSTLGWNNTDNHRDSEDDEQGHITPATAPIAAAAISEKPRWAVDDRAYPAGSGKKSLKDRKWLWTGVVVATLLVLAGLGVGLGIGLTRNRQNTLASGGDSSSDNAGTNSGSGSGTKSGGSTGTATGPAASATPTSGGQGSLITFDDGTTMTYQNSFGGRWVYDSANPWNNGAKANSWTPALNETWKWGINKVYGVNLGGWFVTEPFIVPSLYETYATGPAGTAVDEYTLSQNMGSNLTAAMTEHYETFITERDIAEIATAGLNWVRIPVPHWMVEKHADEPFLERVSWTYFLKAVRWCRKYGIRIKLDLHTLPGSQNGWNHSGRLGTINWMNGVMGLANAQRGLETIRSLTQFVVQPEYAPVVQLWGFINEPNGLELNKQVIGSFYLEAYKVIREVTGFGEGNGPMVSIHDGFLGTTTWVNFAPGADRMAIDQHPYMAFQDQQTGPLSTIQKIPCQWWATGTNTSLENFGVTVAGEWSVAINDCGKWVNRVGSGSRYDGTMQGYTGPNAGAGACAYWNDYTQWTPDTKAGLMHVARGSMDALQNYFFWTWKIGNSTDTIPQPNPFWHYRLGWLNGWIPTDPRTAMGTCEADGIDIQPFDGTFAAPSMTGGGGAGTLSAVATNSYPWPPASFVHNSATNVPAASMRLLPQYTTTGAPVTMPPASYTGAAASATASQGNGWANANDNRRAFVPVSGCVYPPEYSADSLAPTAGACGAGQTQLVRRAPVPAATAAPAW